MVDFPGGAVVKNLPANAGNTGSSLLREDPTCHGANKPVSHNYWSPRTATKSSPRSLQLEKARAQQRRPNSAKINKLINLIKIHL